MVMSEAKGQHVSLDQWCLGSGDFSGRHPRRAFTRALFMRFNSLTSLVVFNVNK